MGKIVTLRPGHGPIFDDDDLGRWIARKSLRGGLQQWVVSGHLLKPPECRQCANSGHAGRSRSIRLTQPNPGRGGGRKLAATRNRVLLAQLRVWIRRRERRSMR
jgi:hypothetical protein